MYKSTRSACIRKSLCCRQNSTSLWLRCAVVAAAAAEGARTAAAVGAGLRVQVGSGLAPALTLASPPLLYGNVLSVQVPARTPHLRSRYAKFPSSRSSVHSAGHLRRARNGVEDGQSLIDFAEFGCNEDGCDVDFDDAPQPRTVGGLIEDPSSEFASIVLADVQRYIAKPASFAYNVLEVSDSGRIQEVSITRGELLESSSLRARDLRAVVVQQAQGSDAGPVLAIRNNTVLLGLAELRAVVQPTRALLFGPPTKDRKRFLRVLQFQRKSMPELDFNLVFVESALLALSRKLDSNLLEIRRKTEPILRVAFNCRDMNLETVRFQRRALVRCASQASAISSSLLARLDGGSLISEGGPSAQDWETMLEVYLQAYSAISRNCASLLDDIEEFEGSAALALQSMRLRVEQFEIYLVIVSVSIAACGLLPSAMGMNLTNGYEQGNSAFLVAILATLVAFTTSFFFIKNIAEQQDLL